MLTGVVHSGDGFSLDVDLVGRIPFVEVVVAVATKIQRQLRLVLVVLLLELQLLLG